MHLLVLFLFIFEDHEALDESLALLLKPLVLEGGLSLELGFAHACCGPLGSLGNSG